MKNDIIKGIAVALVCILIVVGIGSAIGFGCSGGEHHEVEPPEGLESAELDESSDEFFKG